MQPDGDAALLNYHIVGVTRDGVPEPWHLDLSLIHIYFLRLFNVDATR